MMSFQYFNFFLLFSIFACYSQQNKPIEFEYYNTSLDQFDAFKYKESKKSKMEIAEKFEVPFNLITNDSLSIKEKITINSNTGEVDIFKFYDYKTLILKNGLENVNLLNDDLIYVLTSLDLEAFLNFYSSKTDEKYSDIIS